MHHPVPLQMQLIDLYGEYATAFPIKDLWEHYFLLGGRGTEFELAEFVHGAVPFTPREHNLIAVAMNAFLAEFDPGRSVPYVAESAPL
jgi:hypothetical protein